MNWANILPLMGVIVGAGASFAAQYLTTRVTRKQAKDKRIADLRTERKEAIWAFLDAVQSVERLAERRFQAGDHGESPEPATHRMWYLQKCIELVGTPQLHRASSEYAQCLHESMYGTVPDDKNVWEFMWGCRRPFLQAARRELDIPELAKSN